MNLKIALINKYIIITIINTHKMNNKFNQNYNKNQH